MNLSTQVWLNLLLQLCVPILHSLTLVKLTTNAMTVVSKQPALNTLGMLFDVFFIKSESNDYVSEFDDLFLDEKESHLIGYMCLLQEIPAEGAVSPLRVALYQNINFAV